MLVSVSQPLARLPSQSPRPDVHIVSVHVPAVHEADAPANMHALPHIPQCDVLVPRFTSQPLAGFVSQSAKPALQLATAQRPVAHAAVAFGRLQAVPHVPQFVAELVTSTSQPLAALMSQSPRPVAHAATPQRPIAHAAVALGRLQRIPQPAQWFASLWRLTSQPLEASMSQSA